MKKTVALILLIIILGGISGILGSQLFLPWLAGFDFFKNIEWIRQSKEGMTVINKTERILISENEATEEAVAKVNSNVVGITSQRTEKTVGQKKIKLAKPEILAQGVGFVITSDGLVVALDDFVPKETQEVLVEYPDKKIAAEIRKRDQISGLILLKINEANLPIVTFNDGNVRLGATVFLIGANAESNWSKFVEVSTIKQVEPLSASFLGKNINGTPVLNTKGELIGINYIDSTDGQVKIISVSAIKELIK